MPWQIRTSSFEYDSFQILWKYGCWRSWQYSSDWPVALSRTGRAHLWRRTAEYVQLAAVRAKTGIAGYAREQVREAKGLSEGGAEVEARDRVRCATGASVGERSRGTLGGWRPLGVGI